MLTYLCSFMYFSEITQLWSEDSDLKFFVHHHSVSHDNSVCEGIHNFSYQQSKEIHMACYDGWTDLGLFVYYNNISEDECQGCQPPNSDAEDIVAYYFEVSS